MKKLIFAAAIALTITACDNRQAEVDQANRQSDSLASIINERDSSLNDFLSSFNEIEKNLDSIARKQNAINVNVDKQLLIIAIFIILPPIFLFYFAVN